MIKAKEYILFYAFRYALGRKTYAVNDVVGEIIRLWDGLSDTFKTQVKKEIEWVIDKDEAGMDMDIKQWSRILELNF